MVRVKRGNIAKKSRKKVLKIAKGYTGSHSRLFRIANQQVSRALHYSYSGRKNKKRSFRKLWISRINIAARTLGLTYNQIIYKIKSEKIALNRKMLAELAIYDIKSLSLLLENCNQ
jgi:large subunit ribosomal protein L20